MPVQLTAEELAQLRDMDAAMVAIKADIAKAKRAGIDVGELQDRADQVERLRRGLQREYGGGAIRRPGGGR